MAELFNPLTQAAALLRQRSYPEAARLLQLQLRDNPRDHDALQLLGLVQKNLGHLDQARDLMMASLAICPAQPHVLNNLGGVFLRRNEHHNARQCFEKALEFDRANADALRNLALALRGLGELEQAEHVAREALAVDPDFAAAHTTLGQVLLERGKREEAIEENARATALQPNSAEAWRTLAAALHTAGRSREAADALDKAIALRPQSAEAHAFQGAVHQALGDDERAKRSFQRAIEIAPDYEEAHFALNQLLWTRGDTQRFLESYKAAEAAKPEAMSIRCAHAHTLMLVDRYEDAERVLREAAQRSPNDTRVMALLGDVLSQRGQHAEATRLLEQVQQKTTAQSLKIGYARALLRAGEYREALTQLSACDLGQLHRRDLDQEVIALSYIGARFLGDERAARLFDYQTLVRAWEIPTPKGFANLDEFNQALKARLTELHTTTQAPLEQTLRGGTQTYGRLFNIDDPLIQALKTSCAVLTQRYINELPDLGGHPMQGFRPDTARFAGSWSVRLQDGGFHKNHFHGRGWLSSAYYVSLPSEMATTDSARAGWLKFGQPHALPGADQAPEHWVKPEEGVLALFPSYMWHGTEKFASNDPRITVAFDTQSRTPSPGQLGNT